MLWKTTRVGPDSDAELWEVANAVTKSINIIVVTGAGISTSAGIPVSAVLRRFTKLISVRTFVRRQGYIRTADAEAASKTCFI